MGVSIMMFNHIRAAEHYAKNESKKFHGCQQRMDEIEYLMEMADGNSDNLNLYGQKLIESLILHMEYDVNYGKLSQKAVIRWETLKQKFIELNRY
jgi:hypothetical protein